MVIAVIASSLAPFTSVFLETVATGIASVGEIIHCTSMPELAEVEYFRKRWNPGLDQTVRSVQVHPGARIFRDSDATQLAQALKGTKLISSEAQAKQMLFRFNHDTWLGIHLGMTGELLTAAPEIIPDRHDHLVLIMETTALVFRDPRQFGRVRFSQGETAPEWWTSLPPAILSPEFTLERMTAFLQRRKRAPIKAVLLMQEQFPGIGNWMADEVLWRARIHPDSPAGAIRGSHAKKLHATLLEVCRDAMSVIGEDWGTPPETWLFNHRWRDGGICPKTGKPLQREEIGGRTTCFSPHWQKRIMPKS